MSTMSDFFSNAARRVQEVGREGLERGKAAVNGLRGATIGDAAYKVGAGARSATDAAGNLGRNVASGMSAGWSGGPPAASAADELTARNTVQGAQRTTATGLERTPNGLRSTVDSIAERSLDPAGKTGPSKMQMLQNAGNYTPSGLRGLLTKAGRVAGPAGLVAEGYDAASNIAGGENWMKSAGRASLRGGATMLGGAGGAFLGTLAAPGVGTAALGTAGAVGGYKVGDAIADKLFGPAPGQSPVGEAQAAQPAAQPQQGPATAGTRSDQVMVGRSTPNGSSLNGASVPLAGPEGASARPAVLTDTNFGVPASGSGAFRRTTPGNEGPAVALGGDQQAPQPAAAPGASQAQGAPAGANGLREVQQIQAKGLYAAKAGRDNQRTSLEQRGQDVTRESNVEQRRLQRAQLAHTLGNENEKRVDQRTDDYVRSQMPGPKASMTGVGDDSARKEHEEKIKVKTAQVKSDIRYSLSDRKDGRTISDLSPEEHSQLLLASDLKDRIGDARSGLGQSVRDFFGNKRFDSRNLYSYLPTKVEPAFNGGYKVHFGNGNTAEVQAVAGGQFRILGPNGPVDSDIMGLIRPSIEKYEATQGRK